MRVICSLVTTEGSIKGRLSALASTCLAVGCGVNIVRGNEVRSYLENFVEALFPWSKPGGAKTSLGVWTACTWCDGRGYVKKNANVWRACPECYGGHFWIPIPPDEEEFAESGLSQNKKNFRLTL